MSNTTKGDEKNITRWIKTKEKEVLVSNMDDLLSVYLGEATHVRATDLLQHADRWQLSHTCLT